MIVDVHGHLVPTDFVAAVRNKSDAVKEPE